MKLIGTLIMKLLGWRLDGVFPDIPKSVMIMAPHTSMWDFVMGKLSFWALGIKGKFLIKGDMFWFPLGPILKALGGLPVDRGSGHKTVMAVNKIIQSREEIILIITPEGTRKKIDDWKKGYYLIAVHADIPIVLGCIDYSDKVAYVGPVIHPSGEFKKDIEEIEAFYKGRKGLHPDRFNL